MTIDMHIERLPLTLPEGFFIFFPLFFQSEIRNPKSLDRVNMCILMVIHQRVQDYPIVLAQSG